jgi:hypothetical protein
MLQLRRGGSLGVAFLLLAIVSTAESARASDIYTVAGVHVDERANDEVSAKATGIAKAQRDALRKLMERITLRTDHPRLPEATDAVVSRTLRDFIVTEEKFGGGRYIATLSVRFNPEDVRDVLRGSGIPFAEIQSRPSVMLPVYQNAGSTSLWDEPNPWFDAWLRRDLPTGLVPLVLPMRDLSDISEISAEQAVAGDDARLRTIAAKYDAFGVIVALAQQRNDPVNNVPSLEVTMTTHLPGEPARVMTRGFQAREGTDLDGLFDLTASELIVELEEAWKRDNLERAGAQQQIRVLVPVSRLSEWLDVKRKMSSVPSVKGMNVARLSVREAEVDLTFLGEPEQLRRALALKDLDMTYAEDKSAWVVRPRSAE